MTPMTTRHDAIHSLCSAADAHRIEGRYAEAERLYVEALKLAEETLGHDHLQVSVVQQSGGALQIHGALRASRTALPALAGDHRKSARRGSGIIYEIAVNLNNLAALYYATRRFTQAESLYRRALAIKEKLLGPDHPDVAMTLNNLAVPAKSQGKREEAAELYSRALAIFERVLDPSHPKVVTCRENYARLK